MIPPVTLKARRTDLYRAQTTAVKEKTQDRSPLTIKRTLSMSSRMIAAHRLLEEVIASLRNVIAPAIAEPYPKSQAYMAAVILEFVSRQVEERRDIDEEKTHTLNGLFHDVTSLLAGKAPAVANTLDASIPDASIPDQEARLGRLIEWLYAEKDRLGPETFAAANQRVRAALRQLLDQELKVAGKTE